MGEGVDVVEVAVLLDGDEGEGRRGGEAAMYNRYTVELGSPPLPKVRARRSQIGGSLHLSQLLKRQITGFWKWCGYGSSHPITVGRRRRW